MRALVLFLVALVALVTASCALPAGDSPYGYVSVDQVPPATCRTTYRQTFDATAFTDPAEQAAIMKAGQMWRDLSGGQIDMHFAFTMADGAGAAGGVILRMQSTDPETLAYNASQIAKNHYPATWHVDGWTTGQTVHLVINEVAIGDLPSLAAHELGHAAGLRWPFCIEGQVDCVHSPDPHAIMGAAFTGAPVMTPSDLAFCRASCLCP